jgi:hypothetical protein
MTLESQQVYKIDNKTGVVKTRNAGIWRNIMEYGGISRNMAEYQDIFPEYTGTSQYPRMVAMPCDCL